MSQELTLLQQTIKLLDNKPQGLTGEALTVWDDLVNILKGVVQSIINTATSTINGSITFVKNTVTNAVNNSRDFIYNTVNGIYNGINDKLTTVSNTISGKIAGITTDVKNAVTNALGGIGDTLSTVIGWIKDKLEDVVNAIKGIGSYIQNGIQNALSGIGNTISSAISSAIGGISKTIDGIISGVKDWFNNLISSLTKAWNDLTDWIKSIYDGVRDWISTAVKNVTDTLTRVYTTVKQTVEDKIQAVLDWIKTVQNTITTFFWKTVTDISGWFGKEVLPRFNDAVDFSQKAFGQFSKAYEMIMSGNYQGALDTIDNWFKGVGIPAPLAIIHGILSLIAYFWQTIHLQFVPMEVAAQKNANIALALDPIADGQAALGVYRGLWSKEDYLHNAALGGVARNRASVSFETNRPQPSPGQAQQLFLRGEISEQEHDDILQGYGFTSDHIQEIKALYMVIPGVQDIIRMAVREAFSPDIAQRFGQYEDLPKAFVEWAKKQGLNEDWAGRYWASHWDLPSPNMGFEMFQRRIISKDDLTLLLRALDVMPFWREKLIELSYNPITRVDLRRMYQTGVIQEQDVYNGYLDIGYSPENARRLTEFTKRYSAPEDRSEADDFKDLARSTYSSAYKDHIISREEYAAFLSGLKYQDNDIQLLVMLDDYAIQKKDALFDVNDYRKQQVKIITTGYTKALLNRDDAKTMYQDFGFTEEQAEIALSSVDYARELSKTDTFIQSMHDQYVSYMIDSVELHTTLDQMGFYAAEQDRLQEEWDYERYFRSKRPSPSDIKTFWKQGLITDDQYLDELRGNGIAEKYITLYQQSIKKKGS